MVPARQPYLENTQNESRWGAVLVAGVSLNNCKKCKAGHQATSSETMTV